MRVPSLVSLAVGMRSIYTIVFTGFMLYELICYKFRNRASLGTERPGPAKRGDKPWKRR